MTDDRTGAMAPPLYAVLDPCPRASGGHVLQLYGAFDPAAFPRALDHLAVGHQDRRLAGARLVCTGPDHHVVDLSGTGHGGALPPYPAGLLADLLTGSPVLDPGPGSPDAARGGTAATRTGTLRRTLAVTPQQHAWLAGTLAHPERQIEQLSWRWYGPLDQARFTAAWQSVAERETVLRTAFVWEPAPRAVLFDTGCVPVTRHPYDSVARHAELRAAERERGFDLRCPALLRVALLERAAGGPPAVDVLLTYHRAALDGLSARILLQEACRAYLTGGSLPGGERRPDIRDYLDWLHERGPAPGPPDRREHTGGAGPLGPSRASRPRRRLPPPPGPPGPSGVGRCRTGLSRRETSRLAHWAARWGVTESGALHAVWAMLLYRASGAAPGGATVSFGLTSSGRGLLFDGIERTPGPFEHPSPLSLTVDPDCPVPRLLRHLRDRELELAAHEQDRMRPGPGPGEGPAATLITFEHGRPCPDAALGKVLTMHGVHLEQQDPAGALGAYALAVRAYRDGAGRLVLTAGYDRGRVERTTAETMLAHSARLLRTLPDTADEPTTVAQTLGVLSRALSPRQHGAAGPLEDAADAGRADGVLVPLRPGAGRAATVCLVQAPGAPQFDLGELTRRFGGRGPLVLMDAAAALAPAAAAAALAAHAGDASRLVLGGFCGAGAVAGAIARELTARGALPPRVVVVAARGTTGADIRALAGALTAATAR
ncbi:condensation domain-containing protein [Streptomyces sp. NPDC001480]|uniref:condensation domain-containing protein n=1 Tax=Streptomyces sp. NPDC001480 TaxID=3364577 RepID=UPI0036B64FC1